MNGLNQAEIRDWGERFARMLETMHRLGYNIDTAAAWPAFRLPGRDASPIPLYDHLDLLYPQARGADAARSLSRSHHLPFVPRPEWIQFRMAAALYPFVTLKVTDISVTLNQARVVYSELRVLPTELVTNPVRGSPPNAARIMTKPVPMCAIAQGIAEPLLFSLRAHLAPIVPEIPPPEGYVKHSYTFTLTECLPLFDSKAVIYDRKRHGTISELTGK